MAPSTYNFIVPLRDFAHFAEVNAKLQAGYAQAGDSLAAAQATFTHSDQSIWAIRADLSYAPEQPRLSPEEAMYSRVTFIYPYPDRTLAFEELVMKTVALRKKHGIQDPTTFVQLVSGPDAPAYAGMDGPGVGLFWSPVHGCRVPLEITTRCGARLL